jgi:protein SCO1/2
MMKQLRIIVITALVALLSACQQVYEFKGTALSAPHPAPDIALESADGPVSLHDFKGKYTYLFFGYTYCPDVCPLTLATLTQVKEGLGDDGDQMQVVMITVDPQRDTPARMVEYMHFFDDSFVGLSGDLEIIDKVGEPFGLYYLHHEGSPDSGYLVDHTARVFLLDRDSNAILTYGQGTEAEVILDDLQHLIEADG